MNSSIRSIAFCCTLILTARTAVAATFRTVALSAQAAPGAAPGENFGPFGFNDQFYGVTLNAKGRVAFRGNLTNTGIANDAGLWSESNGSLSILAREGAEAVGTEPGVLFGAALYTPIINDLGQTAFYGFIDDPSPGQNDEPGIWTSFGPASTTLVTLEGEPAPGTSGDFADLITNIHFNNAGQLAFTAYLSGPGPDIGNRHGLWSSGKGAGLQLVAFAGDSAPGTEAGVIFGTANPYPPAGGVFGLAALNDRGHTAFVAELLGLGINFALGTGIWSEQTDTGLSLVVRNGDPAPFAGTDVVFNGFSQLRFNDYDRTAFVANLLGPGVTNANDGRIWKETATGLTLTAREGDHAAGTEPTTAHSRFTTLALNAQDRVALIGTLSGPETNGQNDNAIWREGENGLELIAREGNPAPGSTALFGVLGGSGANPFDFFVLNDRGQLALGSQLRGAGVNSANDFGIWAEDANGILTLLVREGDFIDVDDSPLVSDLRQVASLDFFTNPDDGSGKGTLFNNLGQLAFTARFTDGTSGIFVSNLIAVPEPAPVTLCLAVVLLQMCAERVRRHRQLT